MPACSRASDQLGSPCEREAHGELHHFPRTSSVRRGAPLQSQSSASPSMCQQPQRRADSELSPHVLARHRHQGGSRLKQTTPKLHVALRCRNAASSPNYPRHAKSSSRVQRGAPTSTTGPDLLFVLRCCGAARHSGPALQLHGLAAMQALLIPVNIAEERPDKNGSRDAVEQIQYYSGLG